LARSRSRPTQLGGSVIQVDGRKSKAAGRRIKAKGSEIQISSFRESSLFNQLSRKTNKGQRPLPLAHLLPERIGC
jgi:hypothetical protein